MRALLINAPHIAGLYILSQGMTTDVIGYQPRIYLSCHVDTRFKDVCYTRTSKFFFSTVEEK